MSRPLVGDYPAYYENYIQLTKGSNNMSELVQNFSNSLQEFYTSIPIDKENFSYAPGKWTPKEILQHVIDTERIMVYRMLTFARSDNKNLPGFDEEWYAKRANANSRTLKSLQDEWVALRASTNHFLISLTEEMLSLSGTANNYKVTVNAMGFMLFGHLLHHKKVLQEKYLQ
jgi:hypothetical protein